MTDLTYRSPKTELRNSPIHGKGLFAKAPIQQGEIVAVKGGYILNQQQWAAIEPALGSAEIQISEELFIAPVHNDQRGGAMLWTNRSCDPNIALQGQIVMVAMRDISVNEELTHDWATTDDEDHEMTEKSYVFHKPGKRFVSHHSVYHMAKEFARGDVHVNTAESFGAMLERTKTGVFHYMSSMHLNLYLTELSFRWFNRDPKKVVTKKAKRKLFGNLNP